ncbi:hypothetical protein [Salipaludibacillus aurantiacus]|uniref:Uncharacterized protein n=1 Tax=Salipaludibacillus aurantiacus TaxID=1601833 RepID=A0A1H9U1G4_9BACI|nr:hypothetical protein [Salipaludibacillus aurantiacus]SES03061.1 hypothetical protein SAMN05518684_106223 [Salipaludibacillus aurantiacus]
MWEGIRNSKVERNDGWSSEVTTTRWTQEQVEDYFKDQKGGQKMKATKEAYQDLKAKGMTDKEIAGEFGLAINTLYKYKSTEWGITRKKTEAQENAGIRENQIVSKTDSDKYLELMDKYEKLQREHHQLNNDFSKVEQQRDELTEYATERLNKVLYENEYLKNDYTALCRSYDKLEAENMELKKRLEKQPAENKRINLLERSLLLEYMKEGVADVSQTHC